MPHEGNLLQAAVVFLLAAVLTVPLAKHLKLGAVLGYLFAGVIIGPSVLGLVGNPQSVAQFSELAGVRKVELVAPRRVQRAANRHGPVLLLFTPLKNYVRVGRFEIFRHQVPTFYVRNMYTEVDYILRAPQASVGSTIAAAAGRTQVRFSPKTRMGGYETMLILGPQHDP